MSNVKHEGGTGVIERQRDDTMVPPKYRVILHNDDYTPQEFVVNLLMHVFKHEQGQANRIMMQVHEKGSGIAGVYTREVAETKTAQALALSDASDHPLQVTFEPEN